MAITMEMTDTVHTHLLFYVLWHHALVQYVSQKSKTCDISLYMRNLMKEYLVAIPWQPQVLLANCQQRDGWMVVIIG